MCDTNFHCESQRGLFCVINGRMPFGDKSAPSIQVETRSVHFIWYKLPISIIGNLTELCEQCDRDTGIKLHILISFNKYNLLSC
jgi:hypothetical protein